MRIKSDETKRSPLDFSLWKKAVGEHSKALQTWDSRFGRGFPGWHIECSAMAEKIFGSARGKPILDIHTGGEDNIFPHHECEIAQTKCASGSELARIWLHRKHLLVDGEKMSKSKGNFLRLADIEEKGFAPEDFRYLVLGTHYRSQLNFTWEALAAARAAREKLVNFRQRLREFQPSPIAPGKEEDGHDFLLAESEDFADALRDDLNSSTALAAVFSVVKETNSLLERGILTEEEKRRALGFLGLFESIWQVLPAEEEAAPAEILRLAEEREAARAAGDFEKADALRGELSDRGWEMRDGENRKFSLRRR